MTYRDQHTHLSITTPVVDTSALMHLAEDLSSTIASEYLTAFTSLLGTRITRIEHTLTHHHDHNLQNTGNIRSIGSDGTSARAVDDETVGDEAVSNQAVEALLSLRTGAVMVGARRLQLITTQALTQIRNGGIEGGVAVQPLIVQLRQEARWFTTTAARLQHPSTRLAA